MLKVIGKSCYGSEIVQIPSLHCGCLYLPTVVLGMGRVLGQNVFVEKTLSC